MQVGGVSRSDAAVRLIALKLARNFHANAGQVKATAGGFFISPSFWIITIGWDRLLHHLFLLLVIILIPIAISISIYLCVGRAPFGTQQFSKQSIAQREHHNRHLRHFAKQVPQQDVGSALKKIARTKKIYL